MRVPNAGRFPHLTIHRVQAGAMTTPAPGTVIPIGGSLASQSTHKATAALLWGLAPVLLGALVEVLQQATTLFAGAPAWVLTLCSVLLILLAPVASFVGTRRTPNRLLVPITVGPTP